METSVILVVSVVYLIAQTVIAALLNFVYFVQRLPFRCCVDDPIHRCHLQVSQCLSYKT